MRDSWLQYISPVVGRKGEREKGRKGEREKGRKGEREKGERRKEKGGKGERESCSRFVTHVIYEHKIFMKYVSVLVYLKLFWCKFTYSFL